jgi:hypothetical protein
MRILLKTAGFVILILSLALAVSDLARLVAAGGENSLTILARLYGLALVAAGGYLLWRAGARRPSPPLRNPAWHLAALLGGVMLALLAGSLLALALTSVLSNSGLPEADPGLWGLLAFFGGAVVGGGILALGEYRRFVTAKCGAQSLLAAHTGQPSPATSPWPRRWGWLRIAASLLLGLALLVQGLALAQRSQTTNGMDIGASVAGVLASLVLALAAAVGITAVVTLAGLLRPATVPCELAGSLGFVAGAAGILVALIASASIAVGSNLLLPAVLLFLIAYPAALLAYGWQFSSLGRATERGDAS